MKQVFAVAESKTGVCMLFLIGLDESSEESIVFFKSDTFGQGKVITVTIVVSNEDEFGATNLALCSTCGGGQESEVMVSHADLALGAKGTRLLRSKTKKDGPSK
ncbi:unnamed protein product [Cylindrotheca closterium]|uniref:Uncharacterized protein n=1 Tax=Cylindrotheca closterium TaxID=2856 RepID=A0AAD2FUT5_9STRA|nr:unnamed protein product [Cylindrotheca closterium]